MAYDAERRLDIAVSGGCQCGAVRYHASALCDTAHICHCRMCQKAVGNIFAALVAAPREALTWTRGEPAIFMSSDQVARGFCARCGTPLTYDWLGGPRINVTIGSLDDPSLCPPSTQFGVEARVPWFGGLSTLPQEGPTEETMAGMVAQIRASNHQHPDHDTHDAE